jgi:hypothetical protein
MQMEEFIWAGIMSHIISRRRSDLKEVTTCSALNSNKAAGGRVKLTPACEESGWASSWFYCQVPLHKSEVRGKCICLLHSEMTALDYLTQAPHNCAANNVRHFATW